MVRQHKVAVETPELTLARGILLTIGSLSFMRCRAYRLVMPTLLTLWRAQEGQDLTEYALLLAFLALTTAALVIGPANDVNIIWVTGNNTLSAAASSVS